MGFLIRPLYKHTTPLKIQNCLSCVWRCISERTQITTKKCYYETHLILNKNMVWRYIFVWYLVYLNMNLPNVPWNFFKAWEIQRGNYFGYSSPESYQNNTNVQKFDFMRPTYIKVKGKTNSYIKKKSRKFIHKICPKVRLKIQKKIYIPI